LCQSPKGEGGEVIGRGLMLPKTGFLEQKGKKFDGRKKNRLFSEERT